MQDLHFEFSKNNGQIVRIYFVERKPTFKLLEAALRRIRARQEGEH